MPLYESPVLTEGGGTYDDTSLLKLAKDCKKEALQHRTIWERQWMRAIHFVNFRQWITYVRSHNEWRDIRMAKHIPRPVSSKPKETVQALRAMFASVNLGVNVRPNGNEPENIAVATVADGYAPILHEEHQMAHVLNEADYWFIVTGNVFIHTRFERDIKYGYTVVTGEQCAQCGSVYGSNEIADAGQKCPDCGGMDFTPAVDPTTGAPMSTKLPNGKGVTDVLSPFELLFPNTYSRFSDLPYVIRLRWRTKDYYLGHPTLKEQFARAKWQTSPTEQSLQLFRSLPHYNDTGMTAQSFGNNGGSGDGEEGLPEYELWLKPTDEYPDGLVMRWAGDSDPIIIHLEQEEAVPGPLPYRDAEGKPLFTFAHAGFEPVGGRIYASGPIDTIIPRVMFLNQLDSMFQMITQRMSAPQWSIPKGSDIQQMTGEPGTVFYWNPLTVGGNAKPEMINPPGPPASFFQMRDMYAKDVEDGAGTFDIVKGSKPAGVEAFAAMQLLVERSQSRFATAFQSRGEMYKDWFKFALEIERDLGPDERISAVPEPAGGYTMECFKRAQLQGSFSIVVEDGSNTPKTSLGIRAAVEHLNSLGFIDPNDPDQKYKIYQLFGQSALSPTLDIQTKAAHRKQKAFEDWCLDPAAQQQSAAQAEQEVLAYQQHVAAIPLPPPTPAAPGPDGQPGAPAPQEPLPQLPPPPNPSKFTPLRWVRWYDPMIHRQEFIKWANGDRMQEILAQNPAIEGILDAALGEIENQIAMKMAQMAGPPPPKPGGGGIGAGKAMGNSNQNAGASQGNPAGPNAPR